jgi:hypothetical protein
MRPLFLLITFTTALVAAEPSDLTREASGLFAAAKYADAAALYASAAKSQSLTPEQNAAWAYCRLRKAAEEWNASRGETAVGTRVVLEVGQALALVPDHAELQTFGASIVKATGKTMAVVPRAEPKSTDTTATPGWMCLESDNFKVRYPSSFTTVAEVISKVAETQRTAIFERWSGPASGAWAVKCEIIVHPSAKDFTLATNQPPQSTGHALVHLQQGSPSLRRIDLRADDDTATLDALPRELTHVVLADLFPTNAPPKWAADGMAASAMSAGLLERYRATAAKLARDGKLPSVATLLETATPKNADITGFAVGSAALVEFLVQKKGDRAFTMLVRDAKRYGMERALERQYGFASPADLDKALRQHFAP